MAINAYRKNSPTNNSFNDKLTEENIDFFDKSVRGLIKFILKVFNEKDNLTKSQDVVVRCLKKYKRCYCDSEPQEQLSAFLSLYKAHRLSILNGPSKTNWLENSVNVIYVESSDDDEDNKSSNKESKEGKDSRESNIRIMLSPIYRCVKKIVSDFETKLYGINDDEVLSDCKELVYVDVLMLHLYRIFYCCSQCLDNVKTQQKIKDFIDDIEEDLGINKEPVSISSDNNPMMTLLNSFSNPNPNGSPNDNPMNNISGMFGQILNSLTAGMNQQNPNPNPNPGSNSSVNQVNTSQEPSSVNPESIGAALGNLTSQPQITNLIGTMSTELQNCNGDFGQLFGKIGSMLNNGDLMNTFKNSMSQTAVGALEPNPQTSSITSVSPQVLTPNSEKSLSVVEVSDNSIKYD